MASPVEHYAHSSKWKSFAPKVWGEQKVNTKSLKPPVLEGKL